MNHGDLLDWFWANDIPDCDVMNQWIVRDTWPTASFSSAIQAFQTKAGNCLVL
jgi:hypothetical protein